MRCKPGDLAIVVRSYHDNAGKICKVVQTDPDPGWKGYWIVEFPRPIQWQTGRMSNIGSCEDGCLRPIRPGDLEDETPESIIKELSCEHQ